MKRALGFTLIELMLTMALIMILSGLGLGAYTQATVKSRDTQRKSDINQLIKAVESFNNDVGRYPLSDAENAILCYMEENGVVTDPSAPCYGKVFAFFDGLGTPYMTIPNDPTTAQPYPYVSVDGGGFAFYAALENTNDNDLLKDELNNIVTYPEVDCGVVSCNYKVTESGLVKEL